MQHFDIYKYIFRHNNVELVFPESFLFSGGVSMKTKGKDCVADCASGSMSHSTAKLSSVCCDTDKCNAQDAPGIVLYMQI